MRCRRIEQPTDAAPCQVGSDGQELRLNGGLDLVVGFWKGDPEKPQGFERKDHALVVPAAGLIDLDAQTVNSGAIEMGARLTQH